MGLFKKKKTEHHLPEGWSETKISDNLYITNIPEAQKQKWDNERREKDGVKKIAQKNGFHLKNHGRSGTVYYVESEKVCEIYFEISGVPEYDLIFYFDSLENWFLPTDVTMASKDKEKIKLQFID